MQNQTEIVNALPFVVILIPLFTAFALTAVSPKQGLKVTAYGNLLSFVVSLLMVPHIWNGHILEFILDTGFHNINIAFFADSLSILVGLAANFVWVIASFYSIEYMDHSKKLRRYNVFSMLTLTGMLGVVYTRNLFSLYLFFEMLSVGSYVMVIHEESEEARAAGLKYLFMGIFGGLILFKSIIATYAIAGTADLVEISRMGVGLAKHPWMPYIFFGLIFGFGVKAGMFPVHIWLPDAHPIAPAPASALLSGVMIKAGGYGIIRTIYNIVGVDFIRHEMVLSVLLVFAIVNIFLGSAMAIREQEIKRMLAYSSISQMGYILLGAAILTPLGVAGAALHIFNHAIIKGVLFMAAGAFIHQTGLRQLKDLKGIGLKMPIITICFTMAGISMIGFPPLNGFISKWFIVLGSMQVVKFGSYSMSVGVFAVFMLLLSSFMNLMYYGPIIYGAWFRRKKGEETVAVFPNVDPSRWMWVPLVILGLGTLVFGVLPHFPAHFAEHFSLIAFH
jgi:multicomponent Na+:H+ antiporter subunit D